MSAELRFATPFLPDRLRLGLFVDAGEVWERRTELISLGTLRVTPGLGVRYAGNLCVDGQRCRERGLLRPTSSVTGDDFAFAIEPVGTGTGRL